MDSLILKIIKSKKPEDLFSRSNFKKEYYNYMKLLHPDVCSLPGSAEAVKILNQFKSKMEELNKILDDAGKYQIINNKTIQFKGDYNLLQKSLEGYKKLMKFNDEASNHFKKYLPTKMEFKDDSIMAEFNERIVPLSQLELKREHVSWVLSRMYEFVCWMHQSGYCHAGINPESICILPETHGIVCVSFYHLTALGSRLETISAKYMNWYPPVTFTDKRAIPYIDLLLAQRTAIYLLGDKSGNGIKLKSADNEQLIDFLISPHYNSYKTYDDFRKLLKTIFGKPKFHELKI